MKVLWLLLLWFVCMAAIIYLVTFLFSATSTLMNVGGLFASLAFLTISAKTLLFTQNPFKKQKDE